MNYHPKRFVPTMQYAAPKKRIMEKVQMFFS